MLRFKWRLSSTLRFGNRFRGSHAISSFGYIAPSIHKAGFADAGQGLHLILATCGVVALTIKGSVAKTRHSTCNEIPCEHVNLPRQMYKGNDNEDLLWEYVNEGGLNMILRYRGKDKNLIGRVLRFRKGTGANGNLQQDILFYSSVIKPIFGSFVDPGSIVNVDRDFVERLNSDPAIQDRRRPDRQSAKVRHLDTSNAGTTGEKVLGLLCPDLTFCPGGITYEIKIKNVVDELQEDDISRFTLMQVSHFPDKNKTMSRYNPVKFCKAILSGHSDTGAEALTEQLEYLRLASADTLQNNFRVLKAGPDSKVTDAALKDLAKVLVVSQNAFKCKRACDLLASGAVVEATIGRFIKQNEPDNLEMVEAYEDEKSLCGKRLINALIQEPNDRKAMRLVKKAYDEALPTHAISSFMLGRSINDCSVIVNVCTLKPGDDVEAFKALRYFEVDASTRLWGRITFIDTDVKPIQKLKAYTASLNEVRDHGHSQMLIECHRRGNTFEDCMTRLEKAISAMRMFGIFVDGDKLRME